MCNIVAIVGVGNLGKRHAESAERNTNVKEIILVDPKFSDEHQIEKFCSENSFHSPKYTFESELISCERYKSIDLVIIATNSEVRASVFEALVGYTQLKIVIFEKVAFTSVVEWDLVTTLCKDNKIDAYVNCPRRYYGHYNQIQEELDTSRPVQITVKGSNWGLACNAIHMIDLFQYLTNRDLDLGTLFLTDEVFSSKREGYKEIFGTIEFGNEYGDSLRLTCEKDTKIAIHVQIENNNQVISIDEIKKIIQGFDTSFQSFYQSQLTELVIDDIILGKCKLTPLQISRKAHYALLEPLRTFFLSRGVECKDNRIPIT